MSMVQVRWGMARIKIAVSVTEAEREWLEARAAIEEVPLARFCHKLIFAGMKVSAVSETQRSADGGKR